jgi:sodium/potassium-transporting ATPase subunit alpha
MPSTLSTFCQVIFCVVNDTIMSVSLMYEGVDENAMLIPPRNARTDRLTSWRFFVAVYLYYGLMVWLCAFGMVFMYFDEVAGLGITDTVLAYDKWTDGYKGYTMDELMQFQSVAGSI